MAEDERTPFELLADTKDIHARCEGARQLSLQGGLDAIAVLVRAAQSDRSPAVRLGAAGAVADILSRHRLGKAAARLDEAAREELLASFGGIDPADNAGLFPMLACLATPRARERIFVGLRDPRGGVRVGAWVGLLRHCASLATMGDTDLEARVVALLRDDRLPPDALAEVARVCAAAGYRSARPVIEGLGLPGLHGELVAEALAAMDRNESPPDGVWLSDGLDAGEVGPKRDGDRALLVIGADTAHQTGVGSVKLGKIRRMHLRRIGELGAAPALQCRGRTWYAARPSEAVVMIETELDAASLDWDALPGDPSLDGALGRLGDASEQPTGASLRLAGLLHARAGRLDAARASLLAATEAKKAPPDTWFFLGEATRACGGDGRPHFEYFLKKTRKKDPYVDRAEARLG